MIGKTLQDYDTVDHLLEEYYRKDFMVEKLFTPMWYSLNCGNMICCSIISFMNTRIMPLISSATAQTGSRFGLLNDIMIGKTLQDYDTVDHLLEEYYRKDCRRHPALRGNKWSHDAPGLPGIPGSIYPVAYPTQAGIPGIRC